MKFTDAAAIVALFACVAQAAPQGNVQIREEQATNGIFDFFTDGRGGDGGNFFSDIFDSAACFVSGFIGGGNPLCFEGRGGNNGNGLGVIKEDDEAPVKTSDVASTGYSFKYSKAGDGSYKVTITPKDKKKEPCTYTIDAEGKDVEEVINDAAKRCL